MSVLAQLAFTRRHGHWGASAGDFFVGSWVFVLAIVAALAGDKKASKFWILALVFGVLACGEFIEDSPYAWMRKLPLFSQLRFPIRMSVVVALFVALAAGRGLTWLEDTVRAAIERAWPVIVRLAKRAKRSAPVAPSLALRLFAGVVAAGATAYVGYTAASEILDHNHVSPSSIFVMAPPFEYKSEFRQARGNRWDAHVWPFASRGTLHCFHEHKLFESANLRGDLPAEEYGAPGTDTKVERVSWSPNEIVLRVRSSGPGRLLVNQNFAEGWKTDVGEVGDEGGLIRVNVPPGEHVVTLRYREWRMIVGALITGATILAIAIGLARVARRRLRVLYRALRALPRARAK